MAKRLWIPVQPRFTLSFKWPSRSLNRVNLQPLERCRYKISSITSEHLCFASEDICFLQNAENAKMPNPKCAHKPHREKGCFHVLIHVFVCLFFHMHWIPPGSLVVTAGKTRSPHCLQCSRRSPRCFGLSPCALWLHRPAFKTHTDHGGHFPSSALLSQRSLWEGKSWTSAASLTEFVKPFKLAEFKRYLLISPNTWISV